MQYAAGLQYRTEKIELSPSAALLSGDIAGLGGATKAYDADRRVNAVFGELNIPVVKTVDLNLAARYADRLVMLGAGHLLAEGTPVSMMTDAPRCISQLLMVEWKYVRCSLREV